MRSSASWHIVRNLRILNGLPLRPARICVNSAGPRGGQPDARARSPASAARGRRARRPTATTSTARLIAIVDQRRAPGAVLDHRHLGDVVELHRRAEHRPHRRHHAQLHAGRAARRRRPARAWPRRARARASTTRSTPASASRYSRSSLLSSSSLSSRCRRRCRCRLAVVASEYSTTDRWWPGSSASLRDDGVGELARGPAPARAPAARGGARSRARRSAAGTRDARAAK